MKPVCWHVDRTYGKKTASSIIACWTVFRELLPGNALLKSVTVIYSLYVNDAPAALRTHLALFADVTRIYATEKHERHVLCKLQRGLTAVNSWCERWNIKINEEKTQAVYFSRRLEFLTM
jgi:hypothetical protein